MTVPVIRIRESCKDAECGVEVEFKGDSWSKVGLMTEVDVSFLVRMKFGGLSRT